MHDTQETLSYCISLNTASKRHNPCTFKHAAENHVSFLSPRLSHILNKSIKALKDPGGVWPEQTAAGQPRLPSGDIAAGLCYGWFHSWGLRQQQ